MIDRKKCDLESSELKNNKPIAECVNTCNGRSSCSMFSYDFSSGKCHECGSSKTAQSSSHYIYTRGK